MRDDAIYFRLLLAASISITLLIVIVTTDYQLTQLWIEAEVCGQYRIAGAGFDIYHIGGLVTFKILVDLYANISD